MTSYQSSSDYVVKTNLSNHWSDQQDTTYLLHSVATVRTKNSAVLPLFRWLES